MQISSAKKLIKWLPENNCKIIQEYRSGIEFALLSDQYEQSTTMIHCKEFLLDSVHGFVNQQKNSLFNFSYDPKSDPNICLEQARLLVANSSDKKLKNKIFDCLCFLHQVENDLAIPSTQIYFCSNPPRKYMGGGAWIFEGDKRWIYSPPMLSMYALLVRVGMVHKNTKYMQTINNIINEKILPYTQSDQRQLRKARPGIKRIIKRGDQNIFSENIKLNYPKNMSVGIIHHQFGICNFSGRIIKKKMPAWF